jgi:hypothetical protein
LTIFALKLKHKQTTAKKDDGSNVEGDFTDESDANKDGIRKIPGKLSMTYHT